MFPIFFWGGGGGYVPPPLLPRLLRLWGMAYYNNCDSTANRLVREIGRHVSMLMKARIHTRRHFTSEVGMKGLYTNVDNRRMLMLIRQRECHSYYIYRDVHYYVVICPANCLFIGYDASRRDEKMNMLVFRRSRIEAESQSIAIAALPDNFSAVVGL